LGLKRRGSTAFHKQSDAQILGFVNGFAVTFMTPSAMPITSLRMTTRFSRWRSSPLWRREAPCREFHFTYAERASLSDAAKPAKKEADELPHRIKAKTAGHHGIVLKWHLKNQRSGLISRSAWNLAFAEQAAHIANARDAVEHQHRWQRQLGIARSEQFAPRAGKKRLKIERSFAHLFIHVPPERAFAVRSPLNIDAPPPLRIILSLWPSAPID
jgi:hypothetical protein